MVAWNLIKGEKKILSPLLFFLSPSTVLLIFNRDENLIQLYSSIPRLILYRERKKNFIQYSQQFFFFFFFFFLDPFSSSLPLRLLDSSRLFEEWVSIQNSSGSNRFSSLERSRLRVSGNIKFELDSYFPFLACREGESQACTSLRNSCGSTHLCEAVFIVGRSSDRSSRIRGRECISLFGIIEYDMHGIYKRTCGRGRCSLWSISSWTKLCVIVEDGLFE